MEAIYGHFCPRCGGSTEPVNATFPEEIQKRAEKIAKDLYNGRLVSGNIDPVMTKLVAEELRKAIIEGFGKDLPSIDYGTPDYNMLYQLEKNIFHFSAARNFQELKSMSLALRDDTGKARSWKDFRDEAMKISGEFNSHLKTEYDTAIGSAQMAGKWVDFEQNKESAPWLRYDTAGDLRVRPDHAKLEGMTKKVDDPIWNIYYPPNGYRCRCDVTQLLHGSETPSHEIQFPDVPDIFKTNLAKDGLIFPKNHPYYIDAPDNILNKAQMLRDNKYSKITRTKSMKADVFVGSMADQVDLAQNIQLSRRLAELGEEVYIRPHSTLRKIKNPELQLGSLTGDFKVFDRKRTTLEKFIRNGISQSNKQEANIPVFVITNKDYSKPLVWQALRGELSNLKRKKNITHVWLLRDKDIVKIKRSDISKGLSEILP